MKKSAIYYILFIYLMFPTQIVFAQDLIQSSTRAISMGNISSTIYDSISSSNNPAALPEIKKLSGTISHQRLYNIKNLGISSISATMPMKGKAINISYQQCGFSVFKQTKTSISSGIKVFQKINIGISINYHSLSFGNELGRANCFTSDIGLLSYPSRGMTFGFRIINPLRVGFGEQEHQKLPSGLLVGMGWQVEKNSLIAIEAEKQQKQQLAFRTGFEYRINRVFFFRLGYCTYPATTSFGTGIFIKKVKLDISASRHYILGYNLGLSLSTSL